MELISCCKLLELFTIKLFLLGLVLRVKSDESSPTKMNNGTMALVPYSPPKTLGKFHNPVRNFTFVGRTLAIHQDWEDGGVAAVVWDAAIVLSRYLEERGDWIRGQRVVELGAGTGLVGMVAALLGGDVVVTDRQVALKSLNTNLENNNEVLSTTSFKAAKLEWGEETSSFGVPYDIIIGADIIYIEDTFQQLFQTLNDLSGVKTVVLLSCRIRYERDNKFLRLLETQFSLKKVSYDKEMDVVIYEARKLNSVNANNEL